MDGKKKPKGKDAWVELFLRKTREPRSMKEFYALVRRRGALIEELEKADLIDPKKLHERVTI